MYTQGIERKKNPTFPFLFVRSTIFI